MTTPTPAYEFFRIEGYGNLFVKIGEGQLARACEECRRPDDGDCLCRQARLKSAVERRERQEQFVATLPRKMTKDEIYANEFTKPDARGVFEIKRPDALGATVYVCKDTGSNLRFRCYK